MEHKLKALDRQKKIELERQAKELQAQFNASFKEKLQSHLEKFKSETKKLRLQLN